MKKVAIALIIICGFLPVSAQVKKVLFLGNSYTYVNDLPGLIQDLALSAGDSLYTDSNTPGGYTLGYSPIQHLTNPTSINKIREGNWDFVVLQEQSQLPAIPALRDSCMIPAVEKLYDSVKLYNPCAEVLLYLTWGRRLGGTQCFVPNYCSADFTDFSQMQDSLTRAYKLAADAVNQPIAPVGEAWRLIIDQNRMILHSSDNSHPSLNGSYLAACVFYSVIFKEPSSGLPYTAGLHNDTAAILQQAADNIVFTNPAYYNLWENDVKSDYSYMMNGGELTTENLSINSTTYLWDFGDGNTSVEFEPVHTYTQSGSYKLTLKACNECKCDSTTKEIPVTITSAQSSIPGSNHNNDQITITGPDSSGNLSFNGFTGNAILRIYNLQGQNILTAPITNGSAYLPPISPSIYVWKLISGNGILGVGKMIM